MLFLSQLFGSLRALIASASDSVNGVYGDLAHFISFVNIFKFNQAHNILRGLLVSILADLFYFFAQSEKIGKCLGFSARVAEYRGRVKHSHHQHAVFLKPHAVLTGDEALGFERVKMMVNRGGRAEPDPVADFTHRRHTSLLRAVLEVIEYLLLIFT